MGFVSTMNDTKLYQRVLNDTKLYQRVKDDTKLYQLVLNDTKMYQRVKDGPLGYGLVCSTKMLSKFCYLIRVELENCSDMCVLISRFGQNLRKWVKK
jgi:hypothetical protein